MTKIKIATIYGTRPEIIKLSRVIAAVDRIADQRLIYTGQNYEPRISTNFFDELKIRKPDYSLSIDTGSFGKQIGSLFEKIEEIFVNEKPDAVLVLGDTNSALSSIVAKRFRIPIFHMEAGNRCFSERVPEEINRKIVDHISDVNLPYSENARQNLVKEGIESRTMFVTGSPMREVLDYYRDGIEASAILDTLGIVKQQYIVLSAHRSETVDDKDLFSHLIGGIEKVIQQYHLPILASIHPRTADALKRFGFYLDQQLRLCDPFGFFDYIKLEKNAFCVLSDSGTLIEESAILRFPAVQIRTESERAEAFDAGCVVLSGFQGDDMVRSIEIAREQVLAFQCPHAYSSTDVSNKVIRHICNYLHTHDRK